MRGSESRAAIAARRAAHDLAEQPANVELAVGRRERGNRLSPTPNDLTFRYLIAGRIAMDEHDLVRQRRPPNTLGMPDEA